MDRCGLCYILQKIMQKRILGNTCSTLAIWQCIAGVKCNFRIQCKYFICKLWVINIEFSTHFYTTDNYHIYVIYRIVSSWDRRLFFVDINKAHKMFLRTKLLAISLIVKTNKFKIYMHCRTHCHPPMARPFLDHPPRRPYHIINRCQ